MKDRKIKNVNVKKLLAIPDGAGIRRPG